MFNCRSCMRCSHVLIIGNALNVPCIHGACARVYTNITMSQQSIARHYMLNMDWLRLYNSNPGVANPDDLLPQQAIQVGPVYSVAPGDTLLSIAGFYLCESVSVSACVYSSSFLIYSGSSQGPFFSWIHVDRHKLCRYNCP